jgi:hypothetical protein
MDWKAFSKVLLLFQFLLPRIVDVTIVTEHSFQPLLVSAVSPIATTLPVKSLLECLALCRVRSTCSLAEFTQEPPTCHELDMDTHKRINPTKNVFWDNDTGGQEGNKLTIFSNFSRHIFHCNYISELLCTTPN